MLEVGLAMILLVSSGLLLRSFAKMLEVDPGFEPSHVLTASLSLPAHDYPAQSNVGAFFANLEQRLEAEPGVKSVGFASNIPIVGQRSGRLIAPEGYVKSSGEGWIIASNYLTQGNYFEAMRYCVGSRPLLHCGRCPTWRAPGDHSQPVVGQPLFFGQGPDRNADQGRPRLCFVHAGHDGGWSRGRYQTRSPRRSNRAPDV